MLALTMVLSNTMVAYAAPEGEPEPTNTVIDETEETVVETTEEESSVEETSVEDTSEEENSESETEEETSEVAKVPRPFLWIAVYGFLIQKQYLKRVRTLRIMMNYFLTIWKYS